MENIKLNKQLRISKIECNNTLAPIHYIFALDDSGSMKGSPWSNLTNSFTHTIDRIKMNDINNTARVSTIVFSSNARLEG